MRNTLVEPEEDRLPNHGPVGAPCADLPFGHLNLRANPFGELEPRERAAIAVVETEPFVDRLTRSGHAGRALGDRGRVNCTAPGSIGCPGGSWDRRKPEAPEVYTATLAGIPFDRYGTPEEIGTVAAFLLAPAARWVTGQTIAVDGGQNL